MFSIFVLCCFTLFLFPNAIGKLYYLHENIKTTLFLFLLQLAMKLFLQVDWSLNFLNTKHFIIALFYHKILLSGRYFEMDRHFLYLLTILLCFSICIRPINFSSASFSPFCLSLFVLR